MTIVLLNGWGMGAGTWQSLLPVLRHYGDISHQKIMYSSDIESVCDAIYHNVSTSCVAPYVFVGWSLGGMLATQIAARYPESIASLITLASNVQFVANDRWPTAMPADVFDTFYQSYEQDAGKALQRFTQLVVKGDHFRRDQQRYLKQRQAPNALSATQGLSGLQLLRELDNRVALTRVLCPSLHFFGEHDALVPLSAAKAIQQLTIAQSHLHHQCYIVPGAGHLLHSPVERIASMVEHFLQERQQ